MIVMSLVHSASFSLVRRKTNSLHYESLHKSIFQKLPGTTEIIAGFLWISIWAVHSASLRAVRPKTSFLYHE